MADDLSNCKYFKAGLGFGRDSGDWTVLEDPKAKRAAMLCP
jgi:hypothetical protein